MGSLWKHHGHLFSFRNYPSIRGYLSNISFAFSRELLLMAKGMPTTRPMMTAKTAKTTKMIKNCLRSPKRLGRYILSLGNLWCKWEWKFDKFFKLHFYTSSNFFFWQELVGPEWVRDTLAFDKVWTPWSSAMQWLLVVFFSSSRLLQTVDRHPTVSTFLTVFRLNR